MAIMNRNLEEKNYWNGDFDEHIKTNTNMTQHFHNVGMGKADAVKILLLFIDEIGPKIATHLENNGIWAMLI